jgi:ATP-binding cassette, subfamily C (CFTR/MRP), member 1
LATVSTLEHSRSYKPSSIIQIFFFVSTVLEAASVRTKWLLPGDSSLAKLFTLTYAAKFVILILESVPKVSYAKVPLSGISKEEQSGIFSWSFITWINPLIKLGYGKDLTLDDIYPIDSTLSGNYGFEKLSASWNTGMFWFSFI